MSDRKEIMASAKRVLHAETDDFVELINLSGLNPETDLINSNLRDVDFGRNDIRSYCFAGADLRGADLSKSIYNPRAFPGARIDKYTKFSPDLPPEGLYQSGKNIPTRKAKKGSSKKRLSAASDIVFANQGLGGKNGLITNAGELTALSYEAIDGYMEASSSISIGRLLTEKILASLLRIGVNKGFLPRYSFAALSPPPTATLGYHLHGAVVAVSLPTKNAQENEHQWLTQYLLEAGALHQSQGTGYTISRRPEAAFSSKDALREARQVGYVLGLLTSKRGPRNRPAISQTELALLSTCTQRSDVVLAATAELNFLISGHDKLERSLSKTKDLKKNASNLYHQVRRSNYRTAAFSAIMKINADLSGRIDEIYEKGASALHAISEEGSATSGFFLENYWRSCWEPLLAQRQDAQHYDFEELIHTIYEVVSDLTLAILTVELALASCNSLNHGANNSAFNQSLTAAKRALPGLKPSRDGAALFDRLQELVMVGNPIEKSHEALDYAMSFWGRKSKSSEVLIQRVFDEIGKLTDR